MVNDLIAFLKARLDETEAVAKAAAQEAGSPSWTLGYPHSDVVYTESGGPIIAGPYADGFLHDALREHIARHDPARVLREVEAKRRTLALLADAQRQFDNATREERTADAAMYVGKISALLDVVKGEAALHAEHADYQEGWRP